MNKDTLKNLDVLKESLLKRLNETEISVDLYNRLKEAVREKKYGGQTIFKIDIYTLEKKALESNERYAEIHFVQVAKKWREIDDLERYPFSPLTLSKSIYTIDCNSIEELINKEIKRPNSFEMVQYIFVTQFPCGKSSTFNNYFGFPKSNYISMRSYDYSGQLVDFTVTSSPGFGKLSKYYGRQKNQIRFDIGDIVEVADLYTFGPMIKIGRVTKIPLDIVETCLTFQEEDNQYLNDSYKIAVIYRESGELKEIYVPSINVFKPRFPVSKGIRDLLKV